MTNEEIIEEVLYEAYQLGITNEVRQLASAIMERGERCKACAYQSAYNQLTSSSR